MKKNRTPPDIVNAVEASFDAAFHSTSLPSQNFWINRWAILSTSEDILRIIFSQTAESWLLPTKIEERGDFITRIDQIKFCVRQAIFLSDRLSKDHTIPEKYVMTKELYDRSLSLVLNFADRYAVLIRAFVSHWAGMEPFHSLNGSKSLSQNRDIRDSQYTSLEFLIERDNSTISPFAGLAGFFLADGYENPEISGSHFHGPHFKKLIKTVKARNGNISYQYVNSIGKSLHSIFDRPLELAPPTWIIAGATFEDLRLFFNGLSTVCAYHLIAVHNKVIKEKIEGAGKGNMLLILDRKVLSKRIESASGMDIKTCYSIMDYFIYNTRSRKPDLSLQPIIEMGGSNIAIPCMMTISNDYERNSLSLQADVEKSMFDSQSSYFSSNMSTNFRERFCSRYHIVTERLFSGLEIDAILFDKSTGTLLIIELKWMLRPAETAEIVSRRSTVDHGIAQMSRRLEVIMRGLPAFCKDFGINEAPISLVAGCVLTEGYMGHPPSDPTKIAVLPRQVFEVVINETENLLDAVQIIRSPLWLPRPGIDYHERFASYLSEDSIVGVNGMEALTFRYERENLPRYIKQGALDIRKGEVGLW